MNVSLVIYCVAIVLINYSSSCPQGWKRLRDSTDKKCFRLFEEQVDYFSALEKCRLQEAHIVTIVSERQNLLLEETFLHTDEHVHHDSSFMLESDDDTKGSWIGLMRVSSGVSDSAFRWITGDRLNFSQWDIDEPREERRNCFTLSLNGRWSSQHCNKKNQFICEIEDDHESTMKTRIAVFNRELNELQAYKQLSFQQLDSQIECILILAGFCCLMFTVVATQVYCGSFSRLSLSSVSRNNDKREQENTYNNNFPSLTFDTNAIH